MYDIDPIKKVEGASKSAPTSTNNKIPQDNSVVNSNSMQNSKNNAKELHSDRDSDGNTLTEEQMNYFKDSKVRDEDGNLLVVYHGTSEDFTVFDRTKSRANMDIQGNFFSPWELDAKGYGEKVKAYYLDIKNPAPEGIAYKALNKFKGQNNAGIKAREYLTSLGYDGVNNGNEEYIAFESNQSKLIDNQNPTSDKDIRYSERDSAKHSDRYRFDYWTPNLKQSEWDLLNYRLSQEIEISDNYLDSATKWLYNESKGTKVFAIYGIGDGTEPTVLYAVGGKKAERIYNDTQRFMEVDNDESNRDREAFGRLFKTLQLKKVGKADYISDLGNRGAETENVRVLLQSQGSNPGADNIRSTEDSESGISHSERDSRTSQTIKAIELENAKLKKDKANLKELLDLQKVITHGKIFTRPSLEKIAGSLRHKFNSIKSDKEMLVKELFKVYNYIADGENITMEDIYDKSERAADMIFKGINHKETLLEDAENVLNFIKGSRIYVDDSLKTDNFIGDC